MSEQQDVLDPARRRRRLAPAILLGTVPAAIAASLILTGAVYAAPAITAAPQQSSQASIVTDHSTVAPSVVAPGTVGDADLVKSVPVIKVTFPVAPVKVTPKVTAPAKSTSTTPTKSTSPTSTKSTTTKSTSTTSTKSTSTTTKTASISFTSYCNSPSASYTTSGSSAKILLTLANKERARIGIGPMSWSTSLASAAQSWSNHMVAVDAKTTTLIDGLSHNPNRPGAENVAVVYSSLGYSAQSALNKMHSNYMHSTGHCKNLLNPAYHHMGAGVAHSADEKTWYTTENFT